MHWLIHGMYSLLDHYLHSIDASISALVFAGLMLVAWMWGRHLGWRQPLEPDHEPETKLTDAAVALLGLLLAFTFAMSLGRHDNRRLMLVAEANGIGDLYTCATLLTDPHRTELQDVLYEYTRGELEDVSHYRSPEEDQRAIAHGIALHNRMTEIVARALTTGTPIAFNLTASLNEVTSANASRIASYEEVVPWNTQFLLLVSSLVALFLLGRQQGMSRKSNRYCLSGTFCFIAMVALVIFVILDLNQPRRGAIKVNYMPMQRMLDSIGK